MDFFEKAHVSKRESSRKEHKSDEVTKKQLKQLLYGYKQSDSKLIRECEDAFEPNILLDESSSVSGFSDLNLTNSSNEADVTRGTVSSDSEDCMHVKNSHVDESSLQNSSNDCISGSLDFSKESMSEYVDENETLSDDISTKFTRVVKSDTSLDVSFSSLEETSTENDHDNSEFDADGALANKILEKLKKKDEIKYGNKYNESEFEPHVASTNKKTKKLKNKHETTSENDDGSDFDMDGALANKILEKLKNKGVANKRGKKRKVDAKTKIPADPILSDKQKFRHNSSTDIEDDYSLNSDEKSNSEEQSDSSLNITNSPDFVSIAPTNMPTQSLMDILGDYNYPTVRNLPESQNLHSTDNSGVFSVKDLSIEDIQIENENQPLQDDNTENVDPRMYENETESEDMNYSTDVHTSYVTSESASNYDDTPQFEDTSEKELSVDSDANFISPVKVFYGSSNCIIVLKHPAEFYIHGKVTAKAIVGSIEIFGYTLQDEPCEIFAPNYNFALCLKSVGEENDRSSLFGKLRSEGLSVPDAEDILIELGEFDGIVSLKRLNNHKIDFVEANITPTDLFSKTSKNVDNCFKGASEMLGCSLYLTRPYKVYEDIPCWREVVQLGFEKNSRGIICGGKGVGKSTFLRYCVNRLLAQGPVLVVDLDPGQAEFTAAGNISATVVDKPLLGPNFTHLKTPNIMLNIGMINTMDNPRRYAAAVSALIAHCNSDKQLKSMPWIVNTMGMCNAIGHKFIIKVILQTQPTYLLQINTRNPKKRFDTLLNKENVKKLYEDFYYDPLFKDITHRRYNLNYSFIVEDHTESTNRNLSMAPRDERYLNFLAYFSELLSPQQQSLLGITPYEVNLRDLHIGLNIRIGDDAVAKVINGKIIALCQQTTDDNARRVFTLKDKPLLCYGHGLIRGLDSEKEILYVITPTPVDKLSLVDTLVYADWVPELRGQEKYLPDGISVPYRTVTMYQRRQLMFAPRRRFNPLQLLKMTRNS